jgi:hypothetical protein
MTIFSIVHEGDSLFAFFWNAWGMAPPDQEGLMRAYPHRLVVDVNGPTSTYRGIIADYSLGGSRIQTNPGDLVDRSSVLDALISPDYPGVIGRRVNINLDTRKKRKWILSLQIGTNIDSTTPAIQAEIAGSYCLGRSAAGWIVILSTLPSRTDGIITNFDTIYAQPYNSIIKSPGWKEAHGVYAISDIASDPRLGATEAADNTVYFQDKVHPTPAGAAVGGVILRSAIETVISSIVQHP